MNLDTPNEASGTSARLKMLLEEVDAEADRLLHTHGIYSLHGYAWSGPDTPSDEYVGLAMWELTPPFEPDWQALMNPGQVVDYEPTKRDEVLFRNGEDFVGTMEFARHSLGMALCYASATDQKYNIFGRAPFWHAVATTITWLNVTSDRLRDYFLMAAFGQDKDGYARSYKKQNGHWPAFEASFEEALASVSIDKERQILSTLAPLAKEIRSYRDERNKIVHEIASKSAEASIHSLEEQRELAKTGKPRQFADVDIEELIAAEKADTTVTSAIEQMKTWYCRLVKAGSLIFEFEYWDRIRTTTQE